MIGKATIIGQEIKYTLDPLTNISSINSFTNSITGQTVTRYFKKYFRYAIEGIYFTDYRRLSNFNLQSIVIDSIHSYVIEVKYVREGTDDTGELILNSVSVDATKVSIDNGYEFNHSNFVKFFDSNDVDVEKWTLNVLKKTFEYGQLGVYVLRGKNLSEIIENTDPEERQFSNLTLHQWSNGVQSEFAN